MAFRILIDISHPAHVSFLKVAIKKLSELGNKIIMTGLIRSKLPSIIEKELYNYQIKYIGKHKSNKLSIIFDANVKKFFNLLFFALNKKIYIGISIGNFTLGLALKILGKPNLPFDDDPEKKCFS